MSTRPHKQLLVWRKTILLIREIYILSESFPPQERYGLTSQVRRASVSILLNIAEGAARQSKKEFAHFLSISQGSVSEVDALMDVLKELNYIDFTTYDEFTGKLSAISALLNGLYNKITQNNIH